MKKRALALCCALALTLTACAVSRERENPPEGSTGVYFAVSEERTGGPAVKCEYHVLSGEEPAVEELMRLLLAGPVEPGLTSPFPPGVSLRSWRQEEGRLTLDLSEQYGGLSGVDLTVADYCIALTLCQIPAHNSKCRYGERGAPNSGGGQRVHHCRGRGAGLPPYAAAHR